MGFRFRKTFGKGPLKMTVSKSGVGYSVGSKAFRVTKKAGGGTRTTASIPSTGISYTTDSKKKKSGKPANKVVKTAQKTTSSSGSGGCLTSCLWILGACLVISLIAKYWKILLGVAVVAVAAFIGFKVYRRNNPKEPPGETSSAPAVEMLEETKPEFEAQSSIPLVTANKPSTNATEQPLDSSYNNISHEVQAESEIQIALNAAYDQFDAEVQSIPRIDIPLSEPVSRQLLKNMPEYTFSNITRKTRLDSIFPLVILDVETTGLYPSKSEIIEVAALKFEAGMVPVSCFVSYCKPQKPIPPEATAINNITDEMVEGAPAFNQIAPALSDFLKDCHIVGHNLDFDLRFIFAHGANIPSGVRFYDTLDLAHLTVPQSQIINYKLESLCFWYGIWRRNSHSALSDCYATSKVFTKLVLDKTSRQLDTNAE